MAESPITKQPGKVKTVFSQLLSACEGSPNPCWLPLALAVPLMTGDNDQDLCQALVALGLTELTDDLNPMAPTFPGGEQMQDVLGQVLRGDFHQADTTASRCPHCRKAHYGTPAQECTCF